MEQAQIDEDSYFEVVKLGEVPKLTAEQEQEQRRQWQKEDEERDRKELLFDRWLNGDKRVKKKSFTGEV